MNADERNRFLLRNLNWVRKLVRRKMRRNHGLRRFEPDDLVHECCIEMLRRYGEYDPARGSETTFVALVVWRRMDCWERSYRLVSAPWNRRKVDEPWAQRTSEQRYGRMADWSPPVTLDPEPGAAEDVRTMLLVLPGQRRAVLRRLLGLGGRRVETGREVAASYGVSREQVEQWKHTSLRRLREVFAHDD